MSETDEYDMIFWADGSAKQNIGGWAYVYYVDSDSGGEPVLVKKHGSFTPATNNRAELMAILKALEKAINLGRTNIQIRSDSVYAINASTARTRANVNLDLISIIRRIVNSDNLNVDLVYQEDANCEEIRYCHNLANGESLSTAEELSDDLYTTIKLSTLRQIELRYPQVYQLIERENEDDN